MAAEILLVDDDPDLLKLIGSCGFRQRAIVSRRRKVAKRRAGANCRHAPGGRR